MTLTFAGTLDHAAVVLAVDDLTDLVSTARVATAWERESALSGMTVGGLARHLVSQPECAVEFLRAETPAEAQPVSLLDHYGRVDWLDAATEEPENTSIRDHFNSLAGEGPQACLDVLTRARAALPGALAEAPPATYVPWQDCSLHVDDFLVCRLVEIVVHSDDLAVSVGCPDTRLRRRRVASRARPARRPVRAPTRAERRRARARTHRALRRLGVGVLSGLPPRGARGARTRRPRGGGRSALRAAVTSVILCP